MSRCFPYPPPGYTLSRASKEALIESIKLQKESEKAKAQKKKEKRREKKDERKEKKDKRNEMRIKTNEKTDLNSKKRWEKEEERGEKEEKRNEKRKGTNQKIDRNSNKFDFPDGQIGKNICANKEQLERSDLTEEHDEPIRLHLPSTSSESTENSNKRKMQSSPINGERGHGTIIRIKLRSKQNVSDISINEQLCPTNGRTDIPPLTNQLQNFCASSEKTSGFDQGGLIGTGEKQIFSTSGKSEPVPPAKTGTPPGLSAIKGFKKISESLQYQNLIENSVPPSMQDTPFGSEDLDWLFYGKGHSERTEKRQKNENDIVCCSGSSSLWQPRAQLLPEVDVYALPFTVPY